MIRKRTHGGSQYTGTLVKARIPGVHVDKRSLLQKVQVEVKGTSIEATVSKRPPLSLGDENEHGDPIKEGISGSRSCFSVLNSSIDSDTVCGSHLPVILSFWKSWFRQGPCHCNPTRSEEEPESLREGEDWVCRQRGGWLAHRRKVVGYSATQWTLWYFVLVKRWASIAFSNTFPGNSFPGDR